MSKYVRQQIETLENVDQTVFMRMMQDGRLKKAFPSTSTINVLPIITMV